MYSSLVITAMVVSPSYLVYSQAPRPASSGHLVFLNDIRRVFDSPSLFLVAINSSAPDTVVELDIDEASSSDGILAVVGSSYKQVNYLCAGGATTFFFVYAAAQGPLVVNSAGESCVDGYAASSLRLDVGRHVLILSGA